MTRNNQIAVVHGGAPFDEVTQITFRNHAEYALKHGYLLQELRFNPKQPQNKLSMLYQMLQNLEIHRAFWIDSNAIFTNPKLRLTEYLPAGKVVMSYDIFGPSTDCLWLENTPEVRRLLWAASCVSVLLFREESTEIYPIDRRGLRYVSLHPPYHQLFTYVEQTVMRSQLNEYYSDGRPDDGFGQWQPGDFILHVGGLHSTMKVSILQDMLNLSSKISE
ncbi:MAG: hypothetical protein C5B47_06935 [Verrucomicrobia bacterium]|nr:MAG: hypothetical protein C5B47_06935 [Verrucomicrobiota bacterium]